MPAFENTNILHTSFFIIIIKEAEQVHNLKNVRVLWRLNNSVIIIARDNENGLTAMNVWYLKKFL